MATHWVAVTFSSGEQKVTQECVLTLLVGLTCELQWGHANTLQGDSEFQDTLVIRHGT